MSYLIGRGIDKDIISECIDNRLIYEDLPNHNVVFVGYDKIKYQDMQESEQQIIVDI